MKVGHSEAHHDKSGNSERPAPAAKTSSAYADFAVLLRAATSTSRRTASSGPIGLGATAAAFELAVKHVVIEQAIGTTSSTDHHHQQGKSNAPAIPNRAPQRDIQDCRTVMKSLLKRGDIATYVQDFNLCHAPARRTR